MTQAQGIRMKDPAHPGGFVKTAIIEPLGLSVTAAAQALGITRAALSVFLNERAALSADIAIRFEKFFGVSMETLMRIQNGLEIAQARKREGLPSPVTCRRREHPDNRSHFSVPSIAIGLLTMAKIRPFDMRLIEDAFEMGGCYVRARQESCVRGLVSSDPAIRRLTCNLPLKNR